MKLLVLVGLFAIAYAKHEQYIGWKSYFVSPTSPEQVDNINALSDVLELDFLSHATVQREGVVLVKPPYQETFTKTLDCLGIAYNIHADDVKARLDVDDERIEAKRNISMTRNGGRELPYDNYQRLDVIYDYLEYIAESFPETVTLASAGNSFEGRPIKYLKISTTKFEDLSKPVIFIDGGIHARERISPPSVTWVIRKLTEDVTEADLLNDFDWVIMPVVNPDGYEYSFTTTQFWRKTRSNDTHPLSVMCPGVDGNRNYNFVWNTIGTSNNPCGETYAGNRAFSEVEIRAHRDLLHEHLARIALYLTIHSYGSMILYPWGHDGTLSNNALALHTVGIAMADAIHAKALPYFPRYQVGNSLHVIRYAIAGSAEDYAHWIGVPLSYTYELPGLEGGLDGFYLDPIYIEQVCREIWEGIAVGATRAGALFRSTRNNV